MAHEVKFTVPQRPVGNADIEFVVANGRKLGTLKVSKGGVEWVPADHTYGHPLGWAKFAELMSEQERP